LTFIANDANFARPDALVDADKTLVDTILRPLLLWESENYNMQQIVFGLVNRRSKRAVYS
jgi:hypothetical protein